MMSLERLIAIVASVAAALAGLATALYYLTKTRLEKAQQRTDTNSLHQALAQLHDKLANITNGPPSQPKEDTAELRQRIAHLEFRLAQLHQPVDDVTQNTEIKSGSEAAHAGQEQRVQASITPRKTITRRRLLL